MIDYRFSRGTTLDAFAVRKKVFMDEQGFSYDEEPFDKTAWCLVIYWNNAPIATASFYPEDPETFHLRRVSVLAEFRHHKIGSYLLRFAEAKIKELGGRKVICLVQEDKVSFYQRNGYLVAHDDEVVYEENVPHLWMEKVIVKPRYPYASKN